MMKITKRSSNLRFASHGQNSTNRICAKEKYLYRGVKKDSKGYWVYRFYEDGKRKTRGCFKTPEEAARAFDEMAKRVYGEFAVLNFPEG